MDTEIFRKKLEDEKARLEKDLSGVGVRTEREGDWEATPAMTEQEADPNDEASEVTAFEERNAIEAELETRLHQVEDALEAIEKGNYGYCLAHGEKHLIEEARLLANPAATTCEAHM